MPNLREVWDLLTMAHLEGKFIEEELFLLLKLNTSNNLDLNFSKYPEFNLENTSEDDCIAEFHFRKNNIKRLQRAFKVPNEIVCYLYNDLKVYVTEALYVLLKRLAYPCRYDSTNWPSCSSICMIFNQVVDIADQQWRRLLNNFNQPLLRPDLLESYAGAIYRKGSALNNVWRFIDGTTRPCARPRCEQSLVYNGHKGCHCLKYQSITTPNGITANLFGPLEGRRLLKSFMLPHSGVMFQLEQHSFDSQRNSLCIYGDAGYPLRRYLKTPFLGTLRNSKKISRSYE